MASYRLNGPAVKSARAADAFESAFRVAPEVACQVRADGLGIFDWRTPAFDGFELPRNDDLVVALHHGGSRQVRQITAAGPSSTRSVPGRITLLPPGQPARFVTRGSVGVVTLHIPTSTSVAHALVSLEQASRNCFALRDPYVGAALEALARAARDPSALPPNYLSRVAEALLCHLEHWARALTDGGRATENVDLDRFVGCVPLRQLLGHIDAQLQRKLSLDELAAYCGLKRAQFSLAFQVATGSSPHQHVVRRRLHSASKLLLHSGHDLAFIAQECGFSSQSHFTAQFRAFVGTTPLRYRQQH